MLVRLMLAATIALAVGAVWTGEEPPAERVASRAEMLAAQPMMRLLPARASVATCAPAPAQANI